jgi:hypothetical protein
VDKEEEEKKTKNQRTEKRYGMVNIKKEGKGMYEGKRKNKRRMNKREREKKGTNDK